MLSEPTHQKLIDMKLFGFAASFQEYLDQPKKDALAFEERLGLMIDREWSGRSQRRLQRHLAVAKLRHNACLEDIDYRHPRNLDRSVLQRLSACRWIEEHQNLLVTGPTGVGKTWIACALAHQACRQGFVSLYFRVPRLLQNLHLARADGSYPRQLLRLAKTSLLILDDLGIAPLDDNGQRDLLEILEDRHGLASTIVAGQVPVNHWHELFSDPTLAEAFLDRLIHNAHRIEMKGPSLRKPQDKKNSDLPAPLESGAQAGPEGETA
jgi:DNA replication protein DnaC